jgi:hypothetical protein
MAVPPIVDTAEFEAVQTLLKTRSPALTAPRIVSGPTLLTGICFCASCGGAMTLRTGKSGRYRYYTCCTKARQGETGCKGRPVSSKSCRPSSIAGKGAPSAGRRISDASGTISALSPWYCRQRAADVQFFDVVGSRSKRSSCASDDEADAWRQKRSVRSQTNGQRKGRCGLRSYRKPDGWCFRR